MDKKACLDAAESLARALEAADDVAAPVILREFCLRAAANSLSGISTLAQRLHEELESFRRDRHVLACTQGEMPDARERLHYVLQTTEQAARRTLAAVETAMPAVSRIADAAIGLRATASAATVASVETDVAGIKGNLMEILMAQQFQDLTGQVIQRLLALVESLDSQLAPIVAGIAPAPPTIRANGDGPAITASRETHASGQGDVDDLLAGLGL